MNAGEARTGLTEARVARLATVRPDGSPHLVPIVFVREDDRLFTAVDDKPKRTTDLQRLANVAFEPRVSVLVDGYDEDWSRLWWVRVDGLARVADDGPDRDRALALLAAKYAVYRDRPPPGPALVVDLIAWRWWPRG